jgi:hypothetical protein
MKSLRTMSAALVLAGVAATSQAASTFLIDTALPLDGTGYGYGSSFTIGSAGQSLDLVVTATSAGALLDLVLFTETAPQVFAEVDLSKLTSASSFSPLGGGFGLNYSYAGLAAGTYALDVYGAPNSQVRVVGQAQVQSHTQASPLPEAETWVLGAVGAALAGWAAQRRRTSTQGQA